jgi:hypothetical protein
VNAADFNGLTESEKNKRQLDDVLFHEDHVQRPDIQYGGSQSLEKK